MSSIEVLKKICLLGDPAVGKTSLIQKFVFDKFEGKYLSTLGTNITQKDIHYIDKNIKLKLMIWDLMGQKDFQQLITTAYRGASGALIVCDSTKKETFKHLNWWMSSLFNIIGQIPIIFIVNKNDLKDQIIVTPQDISEQSILFNAPFVATSAKTGENVEKAFHMLSKLLIRNQIKIQSK